MLKKFEYNQNQVENKIIWGFFFSLIDEKDEKKYAVHRLANIGDSCSIDVKVAPAAFRIPFAEGAWQRKNERRIAHNISQSFRTDDKFTGKIRAHL